MKMKKEQIRQRLQAILALDDPPGRIATGFAIGVLIGFTPFLGLHTFLAIAVALIFRLNKIITITGTWVNSPLTVAPALLASYKLGQYMLNQPRKPFTYQSLCWAELKGYSSALLLGSTVIGLVAAVISYLVCYWLVVRYRRLGTAPVSHDYLAAGKAESTTTDVEQVQHDP